MPDDSPPQSRHVTTGAGHAYHYHDLGTGRPTIFLHGGGPGCTGWSDFGAVAPLFAADRRCLLVDMLQYGRSDKRAIPGPRWSFHADSVAGLMDALDIDSADFVCNSWGGSAGLALAAAHGHRVTSVVVTGSMPVLDGPVVPVAQEKALAVRSRYYDGTGPSPAKMRDLLADAEWFDRDRIPDATVELRYRQSIDPAEMALAGGGGGGRGAPQDLTDELARIDAPVLYLWGAQDAFLPAEYALMLTKLSRRGSLHVMDRTGHHPQEERPADYHRLVTAFLDQSD